MTCEKLDIVIQTKYTFKKGGGGEEEKAAAHELSKWQ